MNRIRRVLYDENEYRYPTVSFIPFLEGYIHGDGKVRAAVVVVPGGGYNFVSATEAYIVAKAYYEAGYQAYVLTYTTNTFGKFDRLDDQPLLDMSRAVASVRTNADTDCVDISKVAVVGFSAGGHLAASLGVHHNKVLNNGDGSEAISNRPDALVLCYPVITSGKHRHAGSIDALMGNEYSAEEAAFYSLERHVSKDTPPSFLWHTDDDEVVPVENSHLFAQACEDAGVTCQMQLYRHGRHGLSLANEAWINDEIGDSYYVYEQFHENIIELLEIEDSGIPPMLSDVKNMTTEQFAKAIHKFKKMNSAGISGDIDHTIKGWFDLSIKFLDEIWQQCE